MRPPKTCWARTETAITSLFDVIETIAVEHGLGKDGTERFAAAKMAVKLLSEQVYEDEECEMD